MLVIDLLHTINIKQNIFGRCRTSSTTLKMICLQYILLTIPLLSERIKLISSKMCHLSLCSNSGGKTSNYRSVFKGSVGPELLSPHFSSTTPLWATEYCFDFTRIFKFLFKKTSNCSEGLKWIRFHESLISWQTPFKSIEIALPGVFISVY